MRVLLSLRNRQRDERGAVALMVGVLAVVLCVMGAFVVDFGQAYVNKNQAQEAADAGALAAGKVYADAKARCNPATGVITGGSQSAALAEAEAVRNAGMPNSKPGTLVVTCDADGAIKVRYDVQADSPIGLGALVTGGDSMEVERAAAVKWGYAEKAVGNLRPWMICGAQLPITGPPYSSDVIEIGFPGNGHKPPAVGCSVDKPGDWWRTSCYNGGGSHGDAEQNVLVGCDSIQIVPGQVASENATQISTRLRAACPDGKKNETPYCLADDTGHDVKGMADEWRTLLGQTVAMPVFCDLPQCTPTSITKKGNWPVWKIAAVTICGYALHGKYSSDPEPNGMGTDTLPTGDCNDNAHGMKPRDFESADIGFLLIFKGIIDASSAGTFPVETDSTLRLVPE